MNVSEGGQEQGVQNDQQNTNIHDLLQALGHSGPENNDNGNLAHVPYVPPFQHAPFGPFSQPILAGASGHLILPPQAVPAFHPPSGDAAAPSDIQAQVGGRPLTPAAPLATQAPQTWAPPTLYPHPVFPHPVSNPLPHPPHQQNRGPLALAQAAAPPLAPVVISGGNPPQPINITPTTTVTCRFANLDPNTNQWIACGQHVPVLRGDPAGSIVNHVQTVHLPGGSTSSTHRVRCTWLTVPGPRARAARLGSDVAGGGLLPICDQDIQFRSFRRHLLRGKHYMPEIPRARCPIDPYGCRPFSDREGGNEGSIQRHVQTVHGGTGAA
ncbi:hypothetical protein CC1G_02629 [Coprinopsis cinerea okayama7|uniref:Uncharacterized protein n=1 Tax=Coprinopsis cinerea (strain Okayama-7 / 130 / ATCC MYA-4618 / FGSC 9003) TaxID=240176 RepID=A8PBE8_COPC7|nr:hypothetical protein CC1G_02629 [Coprinopsis cinerea okayama7\|eukprot:XP_001840166.2 hypothetical protein CC1G_02629 [Coprinopsis cinerea okayama7\